MIQSNRDYPCIGHRIRQARKAKGISQEMLASDLDVSVNYIGEIERGKRLVSLNMAEKICHYFHLTLDYLYWGIYSDIPQNQQCAEPDPYGALTHLIDSCNEQELQLCLCVIRPILVNCRTLRDSSHPQPKPEKHPIWNESKR